MKPVLRIMTPYVGLYASLVTLLIASASGCSQGYEHPGGASPIVSSDSQEGKRAIAQSNEFFRVRQAQEAKAHARAKKRKIELPQDD